MPESDGKPHADVAELADALDSGSSARKGVEVRILSSALSLTRSLSIGERCERKQQLFSSRLDASLGHQLRSWVGGYRPMALTLGKSCSWSSFGMAFAHCFEF